MPMTDMDLKILDNYSIAHLISKEELDSIIEHMIENYDKSGKFYESNAAQSFLAENIKNHNSVFAILNKKAIEIFEKRKQEKENKRLEREKKWQDPNIDLIALYTEEYDDNALEFEEEYEWEIVGGIYGSILKSFESIARKKIDDRINHRFKVGTKIHIDKYKHERCGNQIEFYHDGAWGVTDKDGIVTISNNLTVQPSKSYPIFHPIILDYVKNQLYQTRNRDTGLYGVISLNPIKELLPCRYREIKSLESSFDGEYHFAIKVLQKQYDGFWGCFNDKGKRIGGFKYDQIEFKQNLIECGRDGHYDSYYENDYDDEPKYYYNGVFDLYSLTGKLLIGGYIETKLGYNPNDKKSFLISSEKLRFKWYKDHHHLTNYEKNLLYDSYFSLVLDDNFTSVIADSNGKRFTPMKHNPTKMEEFPVSIFVPGEVVLIDRQFIISRIELYNQYIASRYIEPVKFEPLFFEETDKQEKNNKEEETGYWEDHLVEKDTYYITHFNEMGIVDWRSIVDDYLCSYNATFIRIGSKVGLIEPNGIQLSNYDAISEEFGMVDERYVAKIVPCDNKIAPSDMNNPNYSEEHNSFIQYYKVDKDGWPIRLEDDWDIFDPNSIEWYPKDFLESMNVYPRCDEDAFDYDDYDDDDGREHGWTDRDLRDAYMAALEDDLSNEWNFD